MSKADRITCPKAQMYETEQGRREQGETEETWQRLQRYFSVTVASFSGGE